MESQQKLEAISKGKLAFYAFSQLPENKGKTHEELLKYHELYLEGGVEDKALVGRIKEALAEMDAAPKFSGGIINSRYLPIEKEAAEQLLDSFTKDGVQIRPDTMQGRFSTKEGTLRGSILDEAKALTEGDRNKAYGSPKPNLTCFAKLIEAYLLGLGYVVPLDAVDGAVIMNLAKMSRISVNKLHQDNYIDAAAYSAIAGECALKG